MVGGVPVEPRGGTPVVHHVVVVPLRDGRNRGVECLRVRVVQVVGVVPAELLQGLGHLPLGRGDQVPPDGPVVEGDRLDQRIVRVDEVAGVDEQVRLVARHRFVQAQAAEVRVEPPSLADRVAGPAQRQLAPRPGRRAEAARDRRAPETRPRQVVEPHAVEDRLARVEPAQVEPGREPGVLECRRAFHPAREGHALAAAHLDDHPRGPIGPAPEDCPREGDVTDLDAARQRGRTRVGRDAADDRRRATARREPVEAGD